MPTACRVSEVFDNERSVDYDKEREVLSEKHLFKTLIVFQYRKKDMFLFCKNTNALKVRCLLCS